MSGARASEGGFGGQLVVALCGAVLFASNVAPTEEIVMMAVEISAWRLLGLAGLSLALARAHPLLQRVRRVEEATSVSTVATTCWSAPSSPTASRSPAGGDTVLLRALRRAGAGDVLAQTVVLGVAGDARGFGREASAAMTKKTRAKVEKNWLEWVVFGVGLVLVVSTLAYLVYDGATSADTPPDIEVRLGEPRPGGAGFLVPVTVINRGGQTAEGVTVEVVLEAASLPEPERGEFTLAFLPAAARARAGSPSAQTPAPAASPRAPRLRSTLGPRPARQDGAAWSYARALPSAGRRGGVFFEVGLGGDLGELPHLAPSMRPSSRPVSLSSRRRRNCLPSLFNMNSLA